MVILPELDQLWDAVAERDTVGVEDADPDILRVDSELSVRVLLVEAICDAVDVGVRVALTECVTLEVFEALADNVTDRDWVTDDVSDCECVKLLVVDPVSD